MKPLRVIGAGEIKYLLPGNRSFTRFSAFSYLEILKRAVRHDGHKGLFPGHRAASFNRSDTARARRIQQADQTFLGDCRNQPAVPRVDRSAPKCAGRPRRRAVERVEQPDAYDRESTSMNSSHSYTHRMPSVR